MTLRLRKRVLADVKALEKLVIEHAEALEPDIRIVDARLVLGDAMIDLVAFDADGGLVLIALGVEADGDMILRALGAFSWCVEEPAAIRERYPSAGPRGSADPRVIFIAERLPEAFRRQVRQLDIPAIDCVEFRHFEADRTAAVSFEVVERLRVPRGGARPDSVGAAVAAAPPASPNGGRSPHLQRFLEEREGG
jgi:hypothetical protein